MVGGVDSTLATGIGDCIEIVDDTIGVVGEAVNEEIREGDCCCVDATGFEGAALKVGKEVKPISGVQSHLRSISNLAKSPQSSSKEKSEGTAAACFVDCDCCCCEWEVAAVVFVGGGAKIPVPVELCFALFEGLLICEDELVIVCIS